MAGQEAIGCDEHKIGTQYDYPQLAVPQAIRHHQGSARHDDDGHDEDRKAGDPAMDTGGRKQQRVCDVKPDASGGHPDILWWSSRHPGGSRMSPPTTTACCFPVEFMAMNIGYSAVDFKQARLERALSAHSTRYGAGFTDFL
jgi:hypothetical protein